MLLALTGSSCSGKTTIAERCVDIDGVVVHESDELGVPSSADLRWRQRTTVLDTAQSLEETTCAVQSWIAAVRDDLAAGRLSLAAGWL